MELPVFIGGVNRSGTTLMRQLLGSHSLLAIPPTDVNVFQEGLDPGPPITTTGELSARLMELLGRPKVAAWGLDREALLKAAARAEPEDRSLLVLLLAAYARAARKPRIGQKTPHYELHLDRFDTWFGDRYRFVHMVRHPLHTYASSRWYDGKPRLVYTEGWSSAWVRSVSIALRRSVTHPHLHRLVRYEDLVARPEQVLDSLCPFAGLAPEVDRMLDMADFDEPDSSSFASMAREVRRHRAVRQRDDVDRSSLISDRERQIVANLCGQTAELVGYDLGASADRPQQRAARQLDQLPFGAATLFMARYSWRRAGTWIRRRLPL